MPELETDSDRLELQPDAKLAEADSYSASQLLGYHDEAFVKNLYIAVLGREATNVEFDHTLKELRAGATTKLDLIESLVDSHHIAHSRVTGLPSPAFRRVGSWPLVGNWLRILRAITRLPQLMRDQQRFEVYAFAQQQRIADFINKQVVPVTPGGHSSLADSPTSASVHDAVEGVLMLSDSLVELAGKQHLMEEQNIALTKDIQRVQSQLEVSESQLHRNLVSITEQIQELQSRLVKIRIDLDQKLDAPKQFLVQEQRVIVEAQKLALQDIEARLNETIKAEVQTLHSAVEQLTGEVQARIKDHESSTAKELERA